MVFDDLTNLVGQLRSLASSRSTGYSAYLSVVMKELQDAGFADGMFLFYQTMNNLQAVLFGTVVNKNSLFDIIRVNHPLRHWKDALEQFEHCRTLHEQTNTLKYAHVLGSLLHSVCLAPASLRTGMATA